MASFLEFLGNILWLFFGGLQAAISWLLAGFILLLTIIGIPFGLQCFKIATFVAWPFGKEAIRKKKGTGRLILNILWAITLGLLLAIAHLVAGIMWAITIIGIPFAIQHFKMIGISFAPFGTEIREKRKSSRKTKKKSKKKSSKRRK